jgi:predicted nucleotidyltransferase
MTLGVKVDGVRSLLAEVLEQTPAVEAAVLYGSAARGDMEPHSDIDLLLLCSSGHKRVVFDSVHSVLSREFEKLSLTLYSHHELRFLKRAASLFLLHLQREAEVLFDRGNFFGDLLGDFRPKSSYRTDFLESLALLDPVRTKVSRAPNNLHRLSYIYSLFRVFGVYLLAEKGIFEFSKSRMATLLSVEYPYSGQFVDALAELRVLNSNFFAGGTKSLAPGWLRTDKALLSSVSALSRLVSAPVTVIERRYGDAVAEFAAAVGRCQRLNYRLRTWFLLLAYDGLNLYCQSFERPTLTSLRPEILEDVLSYHPPSAVVILTEKVLECTRDYRLKYFLHNDAKVSAVRAIDSLRALASELRCL